MIARELSLHHSQRSNFAVLVQYMTHGHAQGERVGLITVTNCHSDDPTSAALEVLNTQALNLRSRTDKTYHLIISFRQGEIPDAETLAAIEARLSACIGFAEHQRVSAIHHDTDHLHLHVAINKVHPTRYTCRDPFQSHRNLARTCVELEREFGLVPDNHISQKCSSENRAADMERQTGMESLLGWVQRQCLDGMLDASTWAQLHQVMRDNGLQLRLRANGLVVSSESGSTVKASSIARALSKRALEERLGPFEYATESLTFSAPRRSYVKAPFAPTLDTTLLFARYQQAQQRNIDGRSSAMTFARSSKERRINMAKQIGRVKRAAIKLVGGSRAEKKLQHALASHTLKKSLCAIQQEHRKACRKIATDNARLSWLEWLQGEAKQGDQCALAVLRSRQSKQNSSATTSVRVSDTPVNAGAQNAEHVTKQGTLLYRVGGGEVRDDGTTLRVSAQTGQQGLQETLALAIARFGSALHIDGSDEFKEQIVIASTAARLRLTFDDAMLEQRRQQLFHSKYHTEKSDDHDQRAGKPGLGSVERYRATSTVLNQRGPQNPIGAQKNEPDSERIGGRPPPASQHRLRELFALGMVQHTKRAAVLLPCDVSGRMAQRGATADHSVRRRIPKVGVESSRTAIPKSGVSIAASAAAAQYIAEREAKRLRGVDIPPHLPYEYDPRPQTFAGLRHVAGVALVLIHRETDVMVLPMNETSARCLKRLAIGDAINTTRDGTIYRKGQGR